ncbi:MAG: hypothetical protein HC927_04635 [Deltaproteobacteria bacterium]|nr:hypothetical protein [Deltaproteobacteria bacterium]
MEAGAELGESVMAAYHARVDRHDRSLYLLDADDPQVEVATELLTARQERVLCVRPDARIEQILAAMDGK